MKNTFRKALHMLIAGVSSILLFYAGILYILYAIATPVYKQLQRNYQAKSRA